MALFLWRGLGRLSSSSPTAAVIPRNWIAAAARTDLKISNNTSLRKRMFASDPPGAAASSSSIKPKLFGGKKTLAELYAFDGIPPSSFTLVYKANLGRYFVVSQTILWLGLSACGVTFLLSIYESFYGKQEDEMVAKERAEQARKEIKAASLIRKEIANKRLGIEEDPESTVIINKPSLADLYEKDLTSFSVFVLFLLSLAFTCTKLMRTIPVRVYIGKKGLCVGTYYGSILPGRIIRKEFVSGTLTTYKGKPVTGDSEIDGCIFRTANGDTIVLFDQFFRNPADFNYILNVGFRNNSSSGRNNTADSYDPSNPNKSPEELLSKNIIAAFDADDPRKKKSSRLQKK